LKELLSEFFINSDNLKNKQIANDEKMKQLRSQVEKLNLNQKKLTKDCSSVDTFEKRLRIAEDKVE